MFAQFSEKAQKVLVLAESIAFDLCHNLVGSEHLLLALLKNKDYQFSIALEEEGINDEIIYEDIIRLFKKGNESPFYMEYSDQVREIIQQAIELSKDQLVTVELLTIALLNQKHCVAYELLCKYHINIEKIKELLSEDFMLIEQLNKIKELKNLNDSLNHHLFIGREKEIKQLTQILCKKEKNNALLIGKAGIGKTALIEELARRIKNNQVYDQLKNKVIYELSLSDVVAGTKYRGEFEEKFKRIINQCIKAKNVILFIDEMHNLIGAGGAEGAIDASNILKPFLARDEITLIGATTNEEYHRFLSKDQAINRRFAVIKLKENSEEETYKILKGIKQQYETYHHVSINDDMLHIIIELTKKYMSSRVFPDKAIDVLDLSCVKTKFKNDDCLKEEYIREVIEELLGIKLNEFVDIEDIEIKLNEHIIGHKRPIHQLLTSLKHVSYIPYQKTKGIYLLLGHHSIGKKEMCKHLSQLLNRHYIQIDMSEYQDYSSIYKIIGNKNYLLNEIHLYPHSLLLIENIEQAHISIIHLLTKIFEEGKIVDENQQSILFYDVIICMTSSISYNNNIGYKDQSHKLDEYFNHNFIEQINEIIRFETLKKEDLKQIVKQFVLEEYIDEVIEHYDHHLGVRPLLNNMRKYNSMGIK